MAGQAQDWLDLPTLKRAIRAEAADDVQLAGHVTEAVDWVGRALDLPLIDRARRFRRRAPSGSYPLQLSGLRYPRRGEAVSRIEWWAQDPPQGAGTLLAEATMESRSVGTFTSLADTGEGAEGDWLLYPPADGWPAQARWLEATVVEGMQPVEHPTLRAAVLNTARDLWMGKTEEAVARLTDRLMAVYAPEAGFLPVQRRDGR